MVNALAVLARQLKILRLPPTLRPKRPGLVAHLAQASSGDLAAGSLAAVPGSLVPAAGSLAVALGRLAVAADSLAAVLDRLAAVAPGRRPVASPVLKQDRSGIRSPHGAPERRPEDGRSRLVEALRQRLPRRVEAKPPEPGGKLADGTGAAAKARGKVGNAGMPGGVLPTQPQLPPINRSPRQRLRGGLSPVRCRIRWAI
jgi:hypothetical protein